MLKQFSSIRSIRNACNYAAQKELPKMQYKPLPRLDDFIMDYRNDRKVIKEAYKPFEADFMIRFEILDEEDAEFMTQYVTELFVEEPNLVKSIGCKGENFIEMVQPMVKKWLSSGTCVIYKEEDKLAGFFLGSYRTRNEFQEVFRGQLFHDNPEFVIKDDYAEDIKNGPFKYPNTNRVAVFLSELKWQTGKFLPKNCGNYGVLELGANHPKYNQYYLGNKAGLYVRDLLKSKGVTHEGGYSITTEHTNLGCQKILYSLPFNKFLENGKPVFENLSGARASVTLMDYTKAS